MRFNTSLLSMLGRSRPGNVINDQADLSSVELVPNLIIAGRYPFPPTFMAQPGETLAVGVDVAGSIVASRFDPLNAVPGTSNWISIPPGVWDVTFYHWVEIFGAVRDLTAVVEYSLNYQDGINPAKSVFLSRALGEINFPQAFQRKFTLTTTKDNKILFVVTGAAGLATCQATSRSLLIANRQL